MAQLFKNNASSVLSGAIGSASTSIAITPGTGDKFPSPTNGDYFMLTIAGLNANGQEDTWEIVKVIGRTGDTLTVVRAQENTTALAWASGSRAELRITEEGLANKVNQSQVLTDVPENAVFTDTVYAHPTYDGDDIALDSGLLTGANVISQITFTFTTDALGHVVDASANTTTRTLTLANLGFTDNSTNWDDAYSWGNHALAGYASSSHTHNYAASSHNHSASNITSGTLSISRIPTGTSSSTVCVGNDSRLSDSRTPTSHQHNASDITAGTLVVARGGTGTTTSTGTGSVVRNASPTFTGTANFNAINASGALTCSSWTATSDARLKTNVVAMDVNRARTILDQVRWVNFDWLDGSGKNIPGLIAQELEAIDPELVVKDKGNYSANYMYLYTMQLAVDQVTRKRLEKLEAIVETLVNGDA